MNWVKLYFKLLGFLMVSMIITCSIPTTWINKSIDLSTKTLIREGLYPTSGLSFRPIVLDNFTDSLMLNTAYSVESGNPVRATLRSVYKIPSTTTNRNDQILNLKGISDGVEASEITYDRYWHGYLVYLRPLLIFFEYSQIRIILNTTIFILAGWLAYLFWKRVGLMECLCILIGLFVVDVLSVGNSMQFSGVFLIGLISTIYFLNSKKVDFLKLLFIAGGITAFADLLTAPLIPFEFLIITFALVFGYKNIKIILTHCFVWTSGYLSIWASKWILSQLFFTKGSFANAIEQVQNRTLSIPDESFSRLATIKLNLFQVIGYSQASKIILLIFAILLVFIFIKNIKNINLKKSWYWIAIALIPYFWYLVAANHSYLHVWFTYRNQFGAITAGLLFVTSVLKNSPKGKNKIA